MLIFDFKRCALFIITLALALGADAQQDHFVYLQTEKAKPFYVKFDNKVVSSSANGYLIIPKLVDGDYNIAIGFPKNEFPEENFQVPVKNKNEGFLLKDFDDKGWGLFNMQSYAVTMGVDKNAAVNDVPKNLQSDPFSKMLAKVVRDSTILQKNNVVKEIIPLPIVDSSSTPAQLTTPIDSAVAIKQTATLVLPSALPQFPKKVSTLKNEDGIEMTYVDYNMEKRDTVNIFMPDAKKVIKSDSSISDNAVVQNASVIKQNENVLQPSIIDSSPIIIEQQKIIAKDDTTGTSSIALSDQPKTSENRDTSASEKTEDIYLAASTLLKDSIFKQQNKVFDTTKDKIIQLPKAVKTSTTNSDCKAFAADEDFLKLRKKMAAEDSDDEMIKIAKKTFHSKCFSTGQIKNLSFLFLTDEGKYKFFDSAYPFVSDSDQYYTLQSQITNSYYINRFKAMVNK